MERKTELMIATGLGLVAIFTSAVGTGSCCLGTILLILFALGSHSHIWTFIVAYIVGFTLSCIAAVSEFLGRTIKDENFGK